LNLSHNQQKNSRKLDFSHRLNNNLSNIFGWRTNRKIIVIESDDWGSLRMSSKSAFKLLENYGLDLRSLDAERYNLNDTLATASDLEKLFEVLSSFKDSNSKSPVFTAVSVVANPDFRKIEEGSFNKYYYEPFTETLKRFPGCDRAFELWRAGIENRLFIPQMHGREHLNVSSWMTALKKGDKQTLLAFREGLWGFVPDQQVLPGVDFQAAFLSGRKNELESYKQILTEGLTLFQKLFGYKAEYFVPPNGPFNNNLNKTLIENGVRYRSASKIQKEPRDNGKTRKIIHWLGQKERSGIIYITRNCLFEPNQPSRDWIDSCLNDIKNAFHWNKPAIISTHRVNYVGALNQSNRDKGLEQLKILLKEISKNWPDVDYLTTPELGHLVELKSR
jgi:hypothetical protein